jgi:hypothetical protein
MTNRNASLGVRLVAALVAAASLAAIFGATVGATPSRQTTARIVVVGYPDLVGTGPQPGCLGCDLAFANGDSLASSADPLPLLEFILRDDQGAELERRTTSALADGRRPASFVVTAPGTFTVELASVPTGWSICPNDSTSKTVNAGDFDTDDRVQLDFYMWHGCTVQETPTTQPTVPGQPTNPPVATATLRPGQTPRATSTPGSGGSTNGDDDSDDEATAAPPTAVPGGQNEIRGLVYIDLNQDGLLAANDPGLGPVTVRLTGQGRTSDFTTPGAGTFTFANLPSGQYVVTVTVPTGYRLTTTGSHTVNVGSGVIMGVDFGVFPEAGLQSLPVPPRTGPPPRLPSTGALPQPAEGLVFGFAALVGLLGALGFALERRAGVRS